MLKCSIDKMDDIFACLAKDKALYLPVNGEGKDSRASFSKWEKGVKYSRDLKTVRSAKDFFFPQTENLADFKVEGKNIEIIDNRSETEDFVLFGVRACDAASFKILDRVYLSEPRDSFYANRREHGTVVTVMCEKPSETCFCNTFSINPTQPGGDVQCYISDKEMFFKAVSEKGEALLSEISALCQNADEKEIKPLCETTEKRMQALPLAGLKTDKFGKGKTAEVFDDKRWETLSEACLGCGTCTFVCPTCQCYDIKDFDTGHGVKRFRCWDSCMYSDFTKMSAGQPRLTQLQRFRQRFMHKLVYYPDNNDGIFGCVGCGRCLSACPISMNIVKVMKSFKEEDAGNAGK